MRHKQKWLTSMVMLSSLTLGLSACGTGGEEKAETKKEITYAIWDQIQQPGMKDVADAFMKENPNVNVKVQVIPWDQYWTKLEASANGNTLPDVFWMHGSEVDRYMKAGALLDLTDSYQKEAGNFPEDLVDLYAYEGKNYGIPKDVSTIGLWYNKALFDDQGIAYPDDTWDWSTLKEMASQLTDKEKGIYGFAAANDTEGGYYNAIFQNEGKVISDDKQTSELNNPATQEALQWWVDFSLKDKVSPTATQFAENNARSYFTSGKLAMLFDGSWMYGEYAANDYIKENVDVTVLPKGKVRATVYNGLSNSVSATTKNQAEAVKFVEFLSSKEGMDIQGKSAAAIPAYKGAEKSFVDETSGTFNTQVFSDMLEYGVLRPNGLNFNNAENYTTENLNKVFSGKETVQEATERIVPEVNKIFSE
ncbi:sugar ABC transporter substrate-binding protein [Vagococcus sp. BWB3-3]|uniref:Sugar ABC transporter substrate-binding protein n=1 Tax=Vagococcus allomyrinae TaxID=2794353 RepID=A0A940P4R2_9ENTE|nr:sugar ABC transporter substrate-binding protein [Vagococcus allomyrinae]MBP1041015.1 sugar ABC transporter substrate-binding protein [Vagococcus allomyrinae]